MTHSIQITESVPIIEEVDVVVVGGGTAGFIAATAAARAGAKTILIERFGYLGGCLTTTYNTTPAWFGDLNGKQVIGGIPWEFMERMRAEGEAFDSPIRKFLVEIWPPTTKKIALDLITEAGVNLYFYTWACDVIKENGFIKGVVVQNKGGRGIILAKTFVDASADADIAAYAGAEFEMSDIDDLQQVSIDYTACGVDAAKVVAWAEQNQDWLKVRKDFSHNLEGAQNQFMLTIPNDSTKDGGNGQFEHVGFMPTVKLLIYRNAVRLQGNVQINPLDPKALTYAETEGIKGAVTHLKYLREHIPGFEHAYIVHQNHLGVRESRRIIGDYVLTLDDLHGQARFDDVVALNCRALDYHLKGTLFKVEFLKGHHDVPLRALTPKGVQNLVVAGRCISCDHLSHASLRGAATSMATGQAAGVSAAVAARGNANIRETDIRLIQRTLLEQGAILSTEEREIVAKEA